jgi:beta-glucanase (GH16 family)
MVSAAPSRAWRLGRRQVLAAGTGALAGFAGTGALAAFAGTGALAAFAGTGALAAFASTGARAAPITAPLAQPERYRLAFEDDFDDVRVARINEDGLAPAPGAVAWRSRYRHPRKDVINQEKQIYMDPAFGGSGAQALGVQPFDIAGSVLTIRADRADPRRVAPHIWDRRYTSGCITTEATHWQTYGYFEMRARMPLGRGFWPAFWLLPKRDAWPPEIDIVEASGSRPGQLHQGLIAPGGKQPSDASGWIDLPRGGRIDRFHVYALEWTRERMTWFVDGQHTFEIGGHAIHEDMYLLANLALGSQDPGWIPDPDEGTPLPGRFEIDYIRAWRRDG